MQYSVFLSYSRRDTGQARRLHAALEASGVRTWRDESNIEIGGPLPAELENAIQNATCFVLLLTPHSNTSKWVQQEVETARTAGKRIFIVSLRGTEPGGGFHEEVRDLVRIDGQSNITQRAKDTLLSAIKSHVRNRFPVVSFLNMKGGVGKTTLAFHLIGCLQERRKLSVLLVDMDPQHNLTQLVVPAPRWDAAWSNGQSILSAFEPGQIAGFSPPDADLETFNFDGVLARSDQITIPLKPREIRKPRFDLVPGHFEVMKYSLPAAGSHRDVLTQNFKKFLETAREHYGLVVLDLNPGASFLTELALRVSTHIVAPVRPDRYSRRGLELLDRLMNRTYRISSPPVRIAVANGVRRSGNSAAVQAEQEILREIRTMWPRVLAAELGQSDLLQARNRQAREDADLTHWMAHRQMSPGGIAIRKELAEAADELAEELGV